MSSTQCPEAGDAKPLGQCSRQSPRATPRGAQAGHVMLFSRCFPAAMELPWEFTERKDGREPNPSQSQLFGSKDRRNETISLEARTLFGSSWDFWNSAQHTQASMSIHLAHRCC